MEQAKKQQISNCDRYLLLALRVNYVKSRMMKQDVFNQMVNFSAKIQGVQVSLDQYPIDLPWTGNKYDGSFFSYEIIIDTFTANKSIVVQSLKSFASRFAPYGGSYPCLSIIKEEKLESQDEEEEQEEDQEEAEDIQLLKNSLKLLQEQIKKLQISQQQIKEQQKEIQNSLAKIEVSSVQTENKQAAEKVKQLNGKIIKDEKLLKQIQVQSELIKQMFQSEDEVQSSEEEEEEQEQQQCNLINSTKQDSSNEISDKQNNNIEVQNNDRNSTKCSDNQSLDESAIKSQIHPTSSDKLDDSQFQNINEEVKIHKPDENKDNQQLKTIQNNINDDKDNLSDNNPQSKTVQITKEEFQQNQKQEQVKIDNNSSPKVQLNIQLNIHKINDN